MTPSAEDVGKWSKEEVGEQVASFGEAFEEYKEIAIKEGIDGATLLDVDDDDLEDEAEEACALSISLGDSRGLFKKRS